MSQFQNPHSPFKGMPPQLMRQNPDDIIISAARTASIYMIVVSLLILIFGACMGFMSTVNLDELVKQQGQPMPALPNGLDWKTIQRISGNVAPFIVGFAVIQLVMSLRIRTGSKPACIAAVCLTSLPTAYFLLSFLFSLLMSPSNALMAAIILGIFVMQMVFLGRLLKAMGNRNVTFAEGLGSPPPVIAPPRPDEIKPDQNPYHAPPVGANNQTQPQTGWTWTTPPPPPPQSNKTDPPG